MPAMRTAVLWALLGCTLHIAVGATVNKDDATSMSECTKEQAGFSAAVSGTAASSSINSASMLTTCKHRAAQGAAVIVRVRFSIPLQPISRNLELRCVVFVCVCVCVCERYHAAII